MNTNTMTAYSGKNPSNLRLKCHICSAETRTLFTAAVLNKHEANYRYCAECDHLFVSEPTWLEEAYSEAIAQEDTDVASRNIFTALRLAAINYFVLGDRGKEKYVDVAGGYGLLTRLMRDLGFNYFWSDRYAANLFARGFEYDATQGACLSVSAVEILEHTLDPLDFIQRTLADHQSDTLIFTTEVFADNAPPLPEHWSYYAFGTGQHIAFFSRLGLARLAERLGMTYYPLGRLHVFSRKRLPRWKLLLASHKLLVIPLALLAAWRLGSRRGRDQAIIRNQTNRTRA
ncbi:class I SAM-dependent methyltransferase [Thiobacillus denitrificans]|uniref:class I SAM-dependent methyltransferase n=1 Tax=Thiobacillus denitrificans TaxID=36861 RepID=UPI001FDEF360|nr:class I SAM-dependent methyltransferase [Thiobacillus denitrificans]